MYPQSEILFPYRTIAALKGLRGDKWQRLVERVAAQPDGTLDTVAFTLLMIRQCDCLNCDMGSYKASLGCTPCAQRTVSSVKASDEALVREFEKAREDVKAYLDGHAPAPIKSLLAERQEQPQMPVR
ncbi:MAG: hypothetical protein Kow0047_33760 [Anaerolineae bacterium]